MLTRITEPHFTNPRRKSISGDEIDCKIVDGFLTSNSAQDLFNSLEGIIEDKLKGIIN
jgi:hypothetical protein